MCHDPLPLTHPQFSLSQGLKERFCRAREKKLGRETRCPAPQRLGLISVALSSSFLSSLLPALVAGECVILTCFGFFLSRPLDVFRRGFDSRHGFCYRFHDELRDAHRPRVARGPVPCACPTRDFYVLDRRSHFGDQIDRGCAVQGHAVRVALRFHCFLSFSFFINKAR